MTCVNVTYLDQTADRTIWREKEEFTATARAWELIPGGAIEIGNKEIK